MAMLRINGTDVPRQYQRLLDLLIHMQLHDLPGVAVAVNQHVVPRSGWSEQILRDGDDVEVVHATAGG